MTNELRKLIRELMDSGEFAVYYQLASDNAMFPHAIINLESISMMDNDNNRFDYQLFIDIYNRNDVFEIENITDTIISKLNALNSPKNNIFPTFYLESRRSIIDEDKSINHRQLMFVVQTYERK